MKVIGLVGESGSGKETFIKFLDRALLELDIKNLDSKQKWPLVHLRFSEVLVKTAKLWNITVNRENLQKLRVVLEKEFGAGLMSQVVKMRVLKNEEVFKNEKRERIYVLDGVRWPSDVKMLEEFSDNLLVYVTRRRELRFEGLKNRKEKANEGAMTWEQFLREESAPNEIHVSYIGETKADSKIENNGTLEEYELNVRKFVDEFLSE